MFKQKDKKYDKKHKFGKNIGKIHRDLQVFVK